VVIFVASVRLFRELVSFHLDLMFDLKNPAKYFYSIRGASYPLIPLLICFVWYLTELDGLGLVFLHPIFLGVQSHQLT